MYVCIAVSVCLCLPSKLRESGVVTIVAMFIIKATIFLMMPLMMTLLRHFTQQLNQICLYGDSTSIGQGQSHRHVVVGKKCCFRMFFDKLAFSPPKFACTREFEQGSSTRTKAFLIKKLTSVSKSSLDFFFFNFQAHVFEANF